jgi:tight adherence protein B
MVLIAVAVFAAVLGIIAGSYWLFVARPEGEETNVVRKRLNLRRSPEADVSLLNSNKALSSFASLERLLGRSNRAIDPLRGAIERAGLRYTVGTVVLAAVFLGVAGWAIAFHFTSSAIAAFVIATAATPMPLLYVRHMATKRLAVFEEQFPEAIDMMARALRAGHTLPTALDMVSEEIPDPIGPEFKRLYEQQNYGMSLPDAFRAFAERIPLIDARFFVTAVLTQREMGGNLSEVLDNLASVIRERFKVKRHVRSVSAHGRITGVVLGFLPPVLALVLFLISPEHIRLLVEEPLGVYMVVGAVILQTVGVLIIRRIVAVEY